MKKKFLLAITALVCVLCIAVCVVACNKDKSSSKADQFISVIDGVFTSAGYRTSGANNSRAMTKSVSNIAYAEGQSDESTIMTNIASIYSMVKTNDNAGLLDDYNLKYLKGDALYQGVNLATLFKSMALVLGDDVFSTVYKVGEPNTVAKLEANEYYTLYGLERDGANVPSAIQIDFKEYAEGKFSFKLAQYSKLNGVAELRYTYYDSESVALIITLQGDINTDFNTYENNYTAFSEVAYSIAIFSEEDYVRDTSNSAELSEAVMKFAKNHLGFDNQTYKNLASIGNGKVIGAKESNEIDSKMSQNRYTNPYMGTNGNMNVKVSNEYKIPDDVTEVATASIPATKKLIVPAHVEKILDSPFKYPQFVEEIVFEDPDNGALVQIGDDDVVYYYPDGGVQMRSNFSTSFLISYTKVKNFTLPKTVKKIAGPINITTDMDVLDLSAYHPDYLTEDEKGNHEVPEVWLYTSLFNESIAFYKELGSVKKLYVNGDYNLKFFGKSDMGGFNGFDFENVDINELMTIKLDIREYDAYNRAEDKHYEYSPTADIYMSIFAMIASGEYTWQTIDYGEYRGYTKVDNLVDELILMGVNEQFDFTSDIFKKASITADVSDFASVYALIDNIETDKEISFTLTEDGQPKTAIGFLSSDGESSALDERMYVRTPDGEKNISELSHKEKFFAPTPMENSIFVGGAKHYFVGWSFSANASRADVYEGELCTNYYQNMYAVYGPVSDGIEYIDNANGSLTAKIDGIVTDVLIIPDTYNGKTVEGLLLVDYSCKKIIMPSSIGVANTGILGAIANNVLSGLKNINRFSDIEDGIAGIKDSMFYDKLQTCGSVVYDNGLRYLRGGGSNYFMLIGADDDISGQVFISNQCSIIATVEFGDGVTSIVMPESSSSLRYIGYMKFGSVSSFSIPSCVKQIERIEGTVRNNFNFPYGDKCKINLFYDAFGGLVTDHIWVEVNALTEESLSDITYFFNADTKLYLSCEYKDIATCNFSSVSDNMYFFSQDRPNFEDEVVAQYNYWHYNTSFNFEIWER